MFDLLDSMKMFDLLDSTRLDEGQFGETKKQQRHAMAWQVSDF